MRHLPGRTRAKKPKGVLLDLDGVLVDTEELKARAHAETVGRYGGRFDPEFYGVVMGTSHDAAARAFIEASGAYLDIDTYGEVFDSVYAGLLRVHVSASPGASRLVAALRGRGFRLAVVSSSRRWMMDEVLTRTGLSQLFDVSISANDVREEKPSPDPYLAAIAKLSLQAGDAVAIEDSESGLASATAAGVRVIAVRHQYNERHDMSQAYAEVDGVADTERLVGLIESAVRGAAP